MIKVLIESPYAGDVERNKKYLKRCVFDCLAKNESPYASHAFFTQFLDDLHPTERRIGIEAGLEWANAADKIVVYEDYGISEGMKLGIKNHEENKREIVYRKIGRN